MRRFADLGKGSLDVFDGNGQVDIGGAVGIRSFGNRGSALLENASEGEVFVGQILENTTECGVAVERNGVHGANQARKRFVLGGGEGRSGRGRRGVGEESGKHGPLIADISRFVQSGEAGGTRPTVAGDAGAGFSCLRV